MEITVFGRTFHIFTTRQIYKLKELIFVIIGSNHYYQFAICCFFLFLLICFIRYIKKKEEKDTRICLIVECIIYIVFLLSALVFSRPPGERSIITWNRSLFMTEHVYHETSFVMVSIKFFMVIPFGITIRKILYNAPMILPFLCAVFTGVMIECMKYYLGRGSAAIGSAIVLSAGIMIGICFEYLRCNRQNSGGLR